MASSSIQQRNRLCRIGFIPLFLMCNLAPENRNLTEVLLPSDTAFLTIHALFSVSSGMSEKLVYQKQRFETILVQNQPYLGFLTNTAMIAGPKQVPKNLSFIYCWLYHQVDTEEEKTLAASILVFSLVFGLFLGAASSYLWVRLL